MTYKGWYAIKPNQPTIYSVNIIQWCILYLTWSHYMHLYVNLLCWYNSPYIVISTNSRLEKHINESNTIFPNSFEKLGYTSIF